MFRFVKLVLSAGLILMLLLKPSYALDADQKAVLDAYKKPWDIYLTAMQDLAAAMKAAQRDQDVVKAEDKFCDEAYRFVDD
jgi:hypothetical protein